MGISSTLLSSTFSVLMVWPTLLQLHLLLLAPLVTLLFHLGLFLFLKHAKFFVTHISQDPKRRIQKVATHMKM